VRGLRKDDPELARQAADAIQTVLLLAPAFRRPLIDSLEGEEAKRVGLKEIRTSGTIRIAFVAYGGSIVLLLAHGDKRPANSGKFYAELIETAVRRFEAWLEERRRDDEGR
jgi:hypothetical protein